ncbi:MAG: TetR/AcrR family transcriptional regulator [Xanthomonadales bacterium]|nr:TetR/AcrR family transcriptional regulator [Xanthomonadales bacterium]
MPQARHSKRNSRLEPLLDAAAGHFAAKGYRETTIRDISGTIGMLPGSVYYHFPSKHELLLAVYEEGVRRMLERIEQATAAADADPWKRVETTLVAHLDAILDQSDYARVLIAVQPDQVPEIEPQLRELRDRYESRFRALVDDLPLPPGSNRSLLRLMLIGAANWSQIWYRPSGQSPTEIARAFVEFLKNPLS